MTNEVKRISLPFESTPVVVLAAINVELAAIDGVAGEVVAYSEYFSQGENEICITIVYLKP